MSTVDLPPAEGELHKQLRAASRKIEHLTELLRESEASSMRLSDQAKLLKEEIRRCVHAFPSFPQYKWSGTRVSVVRMTVSLQAGEKPGERTGRL